MTEFPDDDLQGSLDSIGSRIKSKPDDYESWRTRRMLAEKLGIDSKIGELKFTEEILSVDPKNKYAWCHRKCVFRAFGGWENEITFCDRFLEADICNEYAWDQRIFVVTRYNREAASDEIKYVLQAILREPKNKFSWIHLKYLHEEFKVDDRELDKIFEAVLAKGDDDIDAGGRREDRLNEIQINIIANRRKLINALGALLDLIYFKYCPSYAVRRAVMEMDPSIGSEVEFLKSTCSILKFACPLRDNYWESLVDKIRCSIPPWNVSQVTRAETVDLGTEGNPRGRDVEGKPKEAPDPV